MGDRRIQEDEHAFKTVCAEHSAVYWAGVCVCLACAKSWRRLPLSPHVGITKKCRLSSFQRVFAKSVSFGLSKSRWRAQSSSRASLSRKPRSFISSVAHTPSRKYALRSSFGHASVGNSKPARLQKCSKRFSNSCSWTRCVVVIFFSSNAILTLDFEWAFTTQRVPGWPRKWVPQLLSPDKSS